MKPKVAVDCLNELANGNMTAAQLAEETGHAAESVRKAMGRFTGAARPRKAHIVSWITETPGERDYPRQVYKLGDGPNKARPKPAPTTRAQRYRRAAERNRKLAAASSIFNLAMTLPKGVAR